LSLFVIPVFLIVVSVGYAIYINKRVEE